MSTRTESGHATSNEPRKASKTVVVVAIALTLLVAIGLVLRGAQATNKKKALDEERAKNSVASKAIKVRVVHPQVMKHRRNVDVAGTLRPWRDAELAFQMGGRLSSILVKAGDYVKEGQLLASLDGSRVGAQANQAMAGVRAAQEQLTLAADEMTRAQQLLASKAIPQVQADQAKRQYELAKAQLEGARAGAQVAYVGRGDTVIVAPFSGVVTKAPTSIGSAMTPGMPVIRVEELERFRLSVQVSEEDLSQVRRGSPVRVMLRDQTQVMGKVTIVVPSLDPATRRAPVEIEVPNQTEGMVAWGMVRASISGIDEVNALRLPGTAKRASLEPEVFRLVDGRAKLTKVLFTIDPDGSLIVETGLTADDTIIDQPDRELGDLDSVTVAQTADVTRGAAPKVEAPKAGKP
ncbi:MAG: efflux RND transporter periplasmic adaptor subunit [Polyangiaceae bacterium]|nr:efflux RND transporter periplasmic adaptor subunit [Polyangiaceae bacterium]